MYEVVQGDSNCLEYGLRTAGNTLVVVLVLLPTPSDFAPPPNTEASG